MLTVHFKLTESREGRAGMFPLLSKWCLHYLAFFQPSLSLNMNSLTWPPHSLLPLQPTRLPNDWPQVEAHHFIFLRTPEDISIVFLVKIWSLKESYCASGSFSGNQNWIFFSGSWSVSSSDHGDQGGFCALAFAKCCEERHRKFRQKQT